METTVKNIRHLSLLCVALLLLGACATPHKVSYLQDVGSSVRREGIVRVPVTVQPEDKISIVVNSQNPELADMFNLPVMTHRIGQPMNSNYNNGSTVISVN